MWEIGDYPQLCFCEVPRRVVLVVVIKIKLATYIDHDDI